jgi:hypothetical protein
MTATLTVKMGIGFVGGVVRGVPPEKCAGTCPAYLTEPCGTCPERPIKSVDISFGDYPAIEDAIRAGEITEEQVGEFRKQITGGNNGNT